MRYRALSAILAVVLVGCTEKQAPTEAAPDIQAGKSVAEAQCVGCHGLDGRGAAPAIPHLAAQLPEYLLASLYAYKEGKRAHAGLRDMTALMSDAELRNVVGYYASLPPIKDSETQEVTLSPYEKGKVAAAVCAACHGEDGNSKIPGTPSLAGQQPLYFVAATQEYLHGLRPISTMEATLRGLRRLDLENIALYFAVQTPAQRGAPSFGDVAAGEPLSAKCGGCHGARGVSHDAATPSLAAQDAQYLVSATKAYRDRTRHHDVMNAQLADTSDKDIENIAAFYTVQKPQAAEDKPISAQELAEKCDRCHAPAIGEPTMAVPKIAGQDKDYLVMALRAYRDGKRGASMMHRMSLPYSDTVIESVASHYASRPAR
jgi:cytochrome c553